MYLAAFFYNHKKKRKKFLNLLLKCLYNEKKN